MISHEKRGKTGSRACLFLRLFVFFMAIPAWAFDPDNLPDPQAATFDDLLFHAQRYASTTGKLARKAAARAELFARGTNSLAFLLDRIHIENVAIPVLTQELLEKLPPAEAAPVLLRFIDDERPRVRRLAIYFLSFNRTPEYADRILPKLADDETCGAAIRVLGKWGVRAAVTNLIPLLDSEKEGRRIAAANALRDIGDPRAIQPLLARLNDPVFTVREVAARALSTFGAPAEKALLQALPNANEPARRHIIRTLGVMKSRRALKPLRKLARDADWAVRFDTQRILGN
jgi:HEAT repeat protein